MTEEEIRRAGRNSLVDIADPRLKMALEERKRTGKFQGELLFVRKDGTVFPAELSSVLFKDVEGEWKSTMIIRDVTARRRSEEAQKRLATAVEQVAEAIVITDKQGTIQYVNPAFERITGYSKEEAVGQKPRFLTAVSMIESFTSSVGYHSGRPCLVRTVSQQKEGWAHLSRGGHDIACERHPQARS